MFRRSRARSLGNPLAVLTSIVFLVLIGAAGFIGFQMLTAGKFGKFDRFNLVVAAHPVTVLSLDTAAKTAVVVYFPDDLYITDVYHGYGQYRISAVYAVGQLDRRGGETLSGTVAEYLGIPVEGYFASNRELGGDIKAFFINPEMILSPKTDLNLVDRLQLAAFLVGLRPDKVSTIELSKWVSPLVLADGLTVTILDKEVLDNDLSGDFVEKGIRGEKLRVEVLNSTKVPGLANRAARFLTNMGAMVVNVSDTDLPLSGCQVRAGKDVRLSVTVRRIANVFSCQISDETVVGRADVTMVVGLDYVKKIGK